MNYSFDELGATEFELLVRDLLNSEYRLIKKYDHGIDNHESIIQFNSFKQGKDQGIDLYYEYKPKEENYPVYKVVVQVKRSTKDFKNLKSALTRKINGVSEIDKVVKLQPDKYILATSVPLSLKNKETVKDLFNPYILTVEDVYGRDDLNRMLVTYPEIEKRYVTLYFSNYLVLERLLNNNIYVRSNYTIANIQDSLRKYVQTDSFQDAIELIGRRNVLIIKGMPGIGKTTLAEMLVLYLSRQYQNIYVLHSLKDDYEALIESNEAALFFFDDFLGANYNEVSGLDYDNSRLYHLFRRLRSKRNKKLIVTTRTIVLNKAVQSSEQLSRITGKTIQYEVNLKSFTTDQKIDIVTKHCRYYELNPEMINSNELLEIVQHENFSPRIIDHYFDRGAQDLLDWSEIFDKILKGFDNPTEIWEYSYKNQISPTDKMFLAALFLYGDGASTKEMSDMYQSRIIIEKNHNNYTETFTEYRDSFKSLDGAFVVLRNETSFIQDMQFDHEGIYFINPSVKDFLSEEYRRNPLQLRYEILAFTNLSQLNTQFSHSNRELLRIFDDINDLFFSQRCREIALSWHWEDVIELLLIGSYYYTGSDRYDFFDHIVQHLDEDFAKCINGQEGIDLLYEYSENEKFYAYVVQNRESVFDSMLESIVDEEEIEDFNRLLNLYDTELSEWLSNHNNFNRYHEKLEDMKKQIVLDEIHDRMDEIYNWNKVEEVCSSIKLELLKEQSIFNFTSSYLDQMLNAFDWINTIDYNLKRDFN